MPPLTSSAIPLLQCKTIAALVLAFQQQPAPWPTWVLVITLLCSVGPAILFIVNMWLYQEPQPVSVPVPAVSVLIPARDEEASIRAAVKSVLASVGVTLEVIVLDDASTDRTAEIVRSLSAIDARVRLASAPALPLGWNGKQHACHVLAGLAQYDHFCFLDADVRLEPEALVRLAGYQTTHPVSLVSGFPLEETGTPLEWLLLPLIHFVLLAYLPFARMRSHPKDPALAAGCGQVMLVERGAYFASGGHAAIRATMHDGLLLPQLFRRHGFATDLVDLTNLARCRMYRNARGVWNGLVKNATEGMAAPARIVPFTCLLLFGQVLPLILVWASPGFWTYLALGASYLPRMLAARHYRQSVAGACLHPLGVAILLVLEWYALARKLAGRQATWKARSYDAG